MRTIIAIAFVAIAAPAMAQAQRVPEPPDAIECACNCDCSGMTNMRQRQQQQEELAALRLRQEALYALGPKELKERLFPKTEYAATLEACTTRYLPRASVCVRFRAQQWLNAQVP